jgi:hypothetical protein
LVPGKRYQVFSIKERGEKEEKHQTWVKAGSAFMNRDGSVNVYLDVLPIDGKLHVREPIVEKTNGNNNRAQTNGSSAPQQQHAAFAAEANTQFGGH